jgi:hypothetical protein
MRTRHWVCSGLASRRVLKPVPRFVTIVWCVVISACGRGPTTPSGSSYDGQWSGTTSQGRPIAFTVSSDQKVTAITVGYSFNGCSGLQTFSDLNLDTAPNVTCIPGPCSPGVSSFRAFSYSAGSIDGPLTVVNGGFPSTSRAEGVVGFTNYPGCGTALGVGWTATRR